MSMAQHFLAMWRLLCFPWNALCTNVHLDLTHMEWFIWLYISRFNIMFTYKGLMHFHTSQSHKMQSSCEAPAISTFFTSSHHTSAEKWHISHEVPNVGIAIISRPFLRLYNVYTTHKNADWGMVYDIAIPTWWFPGKKKTSKAPARGPRAAPRRTSWAFGPDAGRGCWGCWCSAQVKSGIFPVILGDFREWFVEY